MTVPPIITYGERAMAEAIAGWSAYKRDQLQTGIRRSTYAALQLAFRHYSQFLAEGDPPYFARRRGAMMKAIRKSGFRVRVRPVNQQTLRAQLALRHIAAAPIEWGGVYEQWVREHRRFQTKVFGRSLAKPRWIKVSGYKRLRWEEARHPLERSMEVTQGNYERISNYALKKIAEGHPSPSRDELMGMA